MPRLKKRSYEDYCKLGSDLYQAKMLLLKASLKGQEMFGKSKREFRMLEKVGNNVGACRALLDNRFCEDIPESGVPEGEPRFPSTPQTTISSLLGRRGGPTRPGNPLDKARARDTSRFHIKMKGYARQWKFMQT